MIPAAVGTLAAATGFLSWAVRGKSSKIFGPSAWHGPRDQNTPPTLALTFDDGPSTSTPILLEFLAKNRIPATFFQCGMNVERHPDIAREVVAAGHELGNHTYSHPHLYLKSAAFIGNELTKAQNAIGTATGISPQLFRAPYGQRWFGLRAAQKRFDLLGVMWTTIGRDWILPANSISDRVLKGAHHGAILCLHDGRDIQAAPDLTTMLDAVRSALPLLLDQGFRFVTVSELLCLNPQRRTSSPNPSPNA